MTYCYCFESIWHYSIMKLTIFVAITASLASEAFVPLPSSHRTISHSTPLYAIGALAKKAKQATLKEYAKKGVPEDVMAVYKEIKANMSAEASDKPGPLQRTLTKRQGTITIIAEYKRKSSFSKDRIHEIFEPELLSPVFREYGCLGIAVMADPNMGGCTYDDIASFVEEQRKAKNEVPGPVAVINSDLVVDELQVAMTKAYGCAACVLNLNIVGADEISHLLSTCRVVDLEAIVEVSSAEEAQQAVDLGARIVSVVHVENVDQMADIVVNLPDDVCTIANLLLTHDDKDVKEVEQAWAIRDKGFNCVWVGEPLYKAGADAVETPGNIIKSMRSKSSLRFASARIASGKGEGAREYLGDILM